MTTKIKSLSSSDQTQTSLKPNRSHYGKHNQNVESRFHIKKFWVKKRKTHEKTLHLLENIRVKQQADDIDNVRRSTRN